MLGASASYPPPAAGGPDREGCTELLEGLLMQTVPQSSLSSGVQSSLGEGSVNKGH